MKIAKDITELIGNTPLVRLNKVSAGSKATVLAKLESSTRMPASRIALGQPDCGSERAGTIHPGKTVLIEPTSGNTGIALAFVPRLRL